MIPPSYAGVEFDPDARPEIVAALIGASENGLIEPDGGVTSRDLNEMHQRGWVVHHVMRPDRKWVYALTPTGMAKAWSLTDNGWSIHG